MTGGQHVDGELSPQQITFQLHSEGIRDIYLVSENPDAYPGLRHRARHQDPRIATKLDAVMKALRRSEGRLRHRVRADLRRRKNARRRKRGTLEDPARRVIINPAVCEGCGDCSVQSNCISVEPLENRTRTQAHHQPVELQQGLFLLERFFVRPSSRSTAANCAAGAPAGLGDIGDLPEPASRPSLERPLQTLPSAASAAPAC